MKKMSWKVMGLIFFMFLPAAAGWAAEKEDQNKQIKAWTEQYEHLLKTYLSPGQKKGIDLMLVDYQNLALDQSLEKLYQMMADFPPPEQLSRPRELALWINAYNFLTLYRIAQKPDIRSIKDLNKLLLNVWQQKSGLIAGREVTLDQIEHQIIRKKFDEYRIHFALVCAALSCPDLRKEAYRAETLDQQLEEQQTLFLANQTKGLLIDHEKKTIRVSRIFSWYGRDFKQPIKMWLKQEEQIDQQALDHYQLKYLPYDWSLNGQ